MPTEGNAWRNKIDPLELLKTTAWWIYRHGPTQVGMLGGAAYEDVCAKITRVPPDTWVRENSACLVLLSRDFLAFGIGIGLASTLLIAWKSMDACMWYCLLKRLRQQSVYDAPQTCAHSRA
jgi:hypothetical protein